MGNVVRAGDTNAAGGAATGGISSVTVEGKPIMVPGQSVTPHPCCGGKGCGAHCSAKTKGGTTSVTVEGKPIITTKDTDTCGHKRAASSSTVTIGG